MYTLTLLIPASPPPTKVPRFTAAEVIEALTGTPRTSVITVARKATSTLTVRPELEPPATRPLEEEMEDNSEEGDSDLGID